MKHILLAGDWSDCLAILPPFLELGNVVSFLLYRAAASVSGDLILLRVRAEEDLERLPGITSPWLAWCATDSANLANQAYAKGAFAVFSKETPADIILQVRQRNLGRLNSLFERPVENVIQRRYQREDVILLEQDTLLEISTGDYCPDIEYLSCGWSSSAIR